MGAIVPSTNTVVEHDFHLAAPPGVTVHSARLYIARPSMADDAAIADLLQQVREGLEGAVRDLMTCSPSHVVMAMTAESFCGGVAGNDRLEGWVKVTSGVSVTTGATACREALRAFGVKRLAVLNPYQPVVEQDVVRFFAESGFEVVRSQSLRVASAISVAEISDQRLVETLRQLDSREVEAIVQVGANLSLVRLADAAERWLGKPVLAVNAAMYWHALRQCGVDDQFEGLGRLLRQR